MTVGAGGTEQRMFGTILVPLDGSDLSERAIAVADYFAGVLGDKILLAIAIDQRDYSATESYWAATMGAAGGVPVPSDDQEEIDSHRIAGAESYLDRQRARFSRAGGVSVRIETGDAAAKIMEIAEAGNAGLIVMGTHGRSGLVRGILGSVTDRVLRNSTRPVIVVPPEHRWRGEPGGDRPLQVVAPLDGSERSERALAVAAPIAKAAGARLTLAHFISVESRYAGMPFDHPPPLRARLSEIRDLAARYLGQVADRLKGEGIEIETYIAVGYPGNQIGELVGVIPNAIVVMTSHGRGGVSRWMMGSVADAVVRTAKTPVMVVPARST